MAFAKAPALLVALAGVVAAQSSVVSVFFPGADQQTLLGSVIKSDASKTTMAVGCPTDVDADDCGFPEPITVTVGPSTFYASEAYESTSAILDCTLTGTTAGVCAETFVGPAGLLDTDTSLLTASDASFDSSITTTATTITLSSTDIVMLPVTLTTGPLLDVTAASSGATGSASTAQETGTTSSGSHTAQSTSATGTASGTKTGTSSGTSATASSGTTNGASKGDSRLMACGAVGAGLVGLLSIMLL